MADARIVTSWNRDLRRFPPARYDAYFLEDYVRLYEYQGYSAECFVYEEDADDDGNDRHVPRVDERRAASAPGRARPLLATVALDGEAVRALGRAAILAGGLLGGLVAAQGRPPGAGRAPDRLGPTP